MKRLLIVAIGVLAVVLAAVFMLLGNDASPVVPQSAGPVVVPPQTAVSTGAAATAAGNPLAGKAFYNDQNRAIVKLAAEYRRQGRQADAVLIERASQQPGAVWLVGPNANDPAADQDISQVVRTSQAAAGQGVLPLYQLYAMPNRDACANYSKGGFRSNQDYLRWIDRIVGSLKGPAVFSVEADAIAQTVMASCLSPAQADARYALLNAAIVKLQSSPNVTAVYLDAGHAEWFPDPAPLVGPLRKAGVDKVRGVAVNVSNFIATPEITRWSQQLVKLLGGDRGVLIDTSRNGQGSVAANVAGDARWCNPAGRGLGPAPTTKVSDASIDAFVYIKNVGESDGDCFGNPPAGTFIPAAALELAKNARQ